VSLRRNDDTKEIENMLTSLEFHETKGDEEVHDQNVEKFELELK